MRVSTYRRATGEQMVEINFWPGSGDNALTQAEAVDLYLQLGRALGVPLKWTTELPTQPGWYWVWTVPVYEQKPELHIVEVGLWGGKPLFSIPADGYEWEPAIRADRTRAWMGPLPVPEPPEEATA